MASPGIFFTFNFNTFSSGKENPKQTNTKTLYLIGLQIILWLAAASICQRCRIHCYHWCGVILSTSSHHNQLKLLLRLCR